jgi:hypothetical protein
MILIISEQIDCSTDDVIDWLRYLNCNFIRINAEDFVEKIVINDEHIELQMDSKHIDFDNINAFWHRRGDLYYKK